MSLISGFLPNLIIGLSILVLLAGIDWRAGRWRRQLLAGAIAAIALTDLVALGQLEFDWVPYTFPVRYYAWIAAIMLALGLCLFARRIGWWRRGLSVLAVPLIALSAVVLINADYQYYPTISSLTGSGAQHPTSLVDLLAHRRQPVASTAPVVATGPIERPAPLQDTGITAVGESVQVTIPATRSHFAARPAWVWVPPAYVSGRVTSLPVVMLLGGTPGRTNDWLRSAYADRTAEAFAEHHDGLAPMLVMPDENGSLTGDTECVDGPPGNAETYLTEDVPAFMHSQFGAAVDDWAVAGFSEGGTCAAMLQLRHPGLFAAFGDFSGLTSPTLGESVDARATARSLFRGSMSAYLAHDPLTLLRQQHLHGGAYFEVGSDDSPALRAQRALVALARKSGLAVCSREIGGGGHTYALWQQAFADSLPVLSAEVALTANPPPQPGCTPLPRSKAGGTVLAPVASPTR